MGGEFVSVMFDFLCLKELIEFLDDVVDIEFGDCFREVDCLFEGGFKSF